MALAGTRQLSVAVETVSKPMQKRIRKFLRVEKVEQTIREAAARRIYTQGFFMLGLPGETRAEMLQTIEFAARSELHTALFFIATPYEGTEMAEMVRAKTAGDRRGFEAYDSLVPSFNLSDVSHEELRGLWRYAYRRFYASPRRLWRIVRDYPRKAELPLIWMNSLSRSARSRLSRKADAASTACPAPVLEHAGASQ